MPKFSLKNRLKQTLVQPLLEHNERFNLGDMTVIGFIGTFGQWHGAEILAEAFGMLR